MALSSSAAQSPHPPPQPSSGPGPGHGPGPGPSTSTGGSIGGGDSSTPHHAHPPTGFQFHRHTPGSFTLHTPTSRLKPGSAPAGTGSQSSNPPASGSTSGFTLQPGFAPKSLVSSIKRTSNSSTNPSFSFPFPPTNTTPRRPPSFSFSANPTHAQTQLDPHTETRAPGPTASHPPSSSSSSSSSAPHQHRPKTPSTTFNLPGLRALSTNNQPPWAPPPTSSSSSSSSNTHQPNSLQIHAPQPIHASKQPHAPSSGFLAAFNTGHGVRHAYDHADQQGCVKYARRDEDDDGQGDVEMRDEDEAQYQEQDAYYQQQQQQQQQQRQTGLALVGGMLTPMTPIPEEDGEQHSHGGGVSSGDTGFHSSEDSAPPPARPFTASTPRPASRDPSANPIPRPAKRPRTSSGASPSSTPLGLAADLQASIAQLAADNQHAAGQLAAAEHDLGVLQRQVDQARAAADAVDRERARERDAWAREREQAMAEIERVKKDAQAQVRELQAQVQAGSDAEQVLREKVQAKETAEQELRAQVERVVGEMHDKERDAQELAQRNAELEAENKSVLAEVQKIQAQVDVLAHVEDVLVPKVDGVLQATQGVDGKLADLALAVESGGDQAAELAEHVEQVHDRVQRVLAGVDGIVPAVTDRLVQLERILADLAPTVQADTAAAAGALGDQLRSVHDDVLAVSRMLSEQLVGEHDKCARVQADLDIVREDKAQVELRVAELAGMVDSAQAQVEGVRQEAQTRIEELVRAREAAEELVQIERARADQAGIKSDKAEEEKASVLSELAQVRTRHAEEKSELEAKVSEREERVKEMEGQVEMLQEQIKRMESDLANSQQLKDAVAEITSLLTTLDQANGPMYAATAAESHNRLSEVEQRISHTLEQLGSAHSEETRRLQVFFGERDAGMEDVRRRDGSAMQQQVKAIEERLAGIHDEVANAVVTRILDKCVTQNLVFVDPNRPAPAAAALAASTAAASMNPAQCGMFQSAPIMLPPPPMNFGAGSASGADAGDDRMVIDVVSSSVEQSQSQQPFQSQDQTDEGSFIMNSPTPPMPATPAAAVCGGGGVNGVRARSRVTFAIDAAVGDAAQPQHPSAGHKRPRPRSPSPDIPLPVSPPPTVQRKTSAAANSRLVRQGIFTQRVESGDSTTTNESTSVSGSTNSLFMSPQMLTSPSAEQLQQIQDPFAFVEGPSTSDLSSPPMADVKPEPAEPVAHKPRKSALVTPIRRAKHSSTTPAEAAAASGVNASKPTRRRVTINAPPSPAMPVEEEDEILGTTRGSRSSRSATASAGGRGKSSSAGSASGTRSRPGSRGGSSRR